MKQFRYLFFLLCLSLLSFPALATHTLGGQFWVEQTGGCTYRIYARDYVDCSSSLFGVTGIGTTYTGPFNVPSAVQFSGAGCGAPAALSGWTLSAQMDATPLCPLVNGAGNSTACDPTGGNPNPPVGGVWERIGYRDYDLCGVTCSAIRISYSSCCWSAAANIVGSPEEYTYLDLHLAGGGGSTPQPNASLTHMVYKGVASTLSFGFSDPEGDSLAYSLVPALTQNATPHTYVPGYSATQPMGPNWIFSLHGSTGNLLIYGAAGASIGSFIVGVEVREYHDGQLASTTHVPMEIMAIDPSPSTPISNHASIDSLSAFIPAVSGGYWANSYAVQGFTGIPLQIPLHAIDYDAGDLVTMIYKGHLAGAVFKDATTGTITDTITGLAPAALLEWTPPAPGRYAYTIFLENPNECSLTLSRQNAYDFLIRVDSCDVPSGLAGVDTTVCGNSAYTLGFPATPGLSYNWTNVGTTVGTTAELVVSGVPGSSDSYVLETTGMMGCVVLDTVTVNFLAQDPAVINYAPDTVCVGDTLTLDIGLPTVATSSVSVDYGIGAQVISGTLPMPVVVWTSAGATAITVIMTDTCGYADSLVHPVFVSGNCTWPGDTDTDGIADNNDLLNIGLGFGNTGPARTGASIFWAAQPFSPWATSAPAGANFAHSDTDGNGIINADDTLAIQLNYGLTHLKGDRSEGGPGDPPLLILPTIDSALVGDTLFLPVILGDMATPADSIYGLAFTIQYDATLIDSASAGLTFGSSWLGSEGVDLLTIQRDEFVNGELDVAITRTDHLNRSGFGMIATFTIVMIDDLAGKNGLKDTLRFNISDVYVIDAAGDTREVFNQASKLLVTDNTTALDLPQIKALSMYPNPTTGDFRLVGPATGAFEVEITDLMGRKVLSQRFRQSDVTLSLEGESAGVYLISVKQGNDRWVGKLTLRN
ncbi:MAG: T9SS type A sorting domain-containing protein [Bacteroidia bacterium]|nr:T9SS type A sorting domain-containing protein [Bacteroidia bacterium]